MTRPIACLLIVDDDRFFREDLGLRLQAAGYRIALAGGGRQALEMLEREHYDLVLLDVEMPDVGGLEVLDRIRTGRSMLDLPVIVVTGYGEDARTIEALRRGANDFLPKPPKIPVVEARIETQLALGELAHLKQRLLRFAGHDLKKPLLLMQDIAQTLAAGLAAGTGERDAADLLTETAAGMDGLLQKFLARGADAGERGRRSFRQVDLNALIREVLEANGAYAARKGVTLVEDRGPSLPPIPTDPFPVRQALDNLLGNAIKFGGRGTRVRVHTGTDDHWVTVEVCDTGPGLRPEDMDKLFTEGAVLSNRPTGGESSSGIGLALSREFVQGLGGEIGARNNPAGGATFWFRLPRIDPP